MSLEQITDHDGQATALLLQQYKGTTVIQGILDTYCGDIQDVEDALFNMPALTALATCVGIQLDGLGDILNTKRQGLLDDAYRDVLYAKIAQNVSQGTPEDVITVYKFLMNCTHVDLVEQGVATFSITAVGANPVTTLAGIKQAVLAAKAGGVLVNFFQFDETGTPFGFNEDPDPNVAGFGDPFFPSLGGTFVESF